MNNKEFDYKIIKELADKAIDPYLVSIEQALNSPSNQHLNRIQQTTLIKQMFHRSLRLMSFNFLQVVDEYVNQLTIEDIEREKRAQAKQKRAENKITAKQTTQKKTLKELREERAKKQQAPKE